MKLKRQIQWLKSMEIQPNRDELFSQKVLAVLPSTVSSVFFALLFMVAAALAVRNVYGVEVPESGWYVLALVVFLIVSLLQELIWYTLKEKRYLASCGVWLFTSLGFLMYLGRDERAEKLIGGVVAFLRLYLQDWKMQYGVRISWYTGDPNFISESVYFALLYLFFVALWLSKVLRKNGILLLPATGIVIAELLVGKVPDRGALFLLLIGILLYAGMSWMEADMEILFWRREAFDRKRQQMQWVGRSLCLCLLCGLIFLTGNVFSQKVIEKQAQKVVALVSGVTEKWEIMSLPKYMTEAVALLFRDKSLDSETLTNSMPQYQQVEVLQVEVSQKPQENLYLRDFCGDVYTNGVWQRDLENLRLACEAVQLEYDAVRAQIAFGTVRRLEESEGENAGQKLRQISVNYTGLVTEAVYIPYYAQVVTPGIGLFGDSGFVKKEETSCVDYAQREIHGKELTEYIFEKTAWDSWYENYVAEQYLYVPEGMDIVEDTAMQIETLWETTQDMLETEMREEVVYNENKIRLMKAQAVANWLAENTTYSLELPALAENVEPIAYFLGTTRTGYCMHYASAAVMLLREMGVPTRYASGYMVEAGAFVEVQEQGEEKQEIQKLEVPTGFHAKVLDDRAHAWVEIYLDALGWVPVEVTKGFAAIEETAELVESITVVTGGNAEKGTGEVGSTVSEGIKGDITREPQDAGEDGLATSGGEETNDSNKESLKKDSVEKDDTSEKSENTEPTDDKENPKEIQDTAPVENSTVENDTEEVPKVQDAESTNTVEDNSHGSANILLKGEVKEPELVSIADTKAETQKILRYVLGLAVFIGIVVILMADTHKFFRSESMHYKQLRREMKKGNHKRVIMMINNGIYRKLRFKKLLDVGQGDNALELALKSNYKELTNQEWERYMNIVKAAAFSQGEFTQEDVKFCFDVYRDVIYKDEVW